jgi:Fe-S-cluster containining protein
MNSHYVKLRAGEKTHFECLRCGKCCSSGPNVGLTAFDVLRIARFLNMDWRELRGRYIVAVVADVVAIPTLRGKVNNECVFLKHENGKPLCSIYPARPIRCRLYPFIPYGPSNNEVIYLDTCCPGINTEKETDPPWDYLREYCLETKLHYTKLYSLVFEEGYDPLEALEKTIEEYVRTYKQIVKHFKVNTVGV